MRPFPTEWYQKRRCQELILPEIAEVLAICTLDEIRAINKAKHRLSKNDAHYLSMILSDLEHPGPPSVNLTRLYGARVAKANGAWFNREKVIP